MAISMKPFTRPDKPASPAASGTFSKPGATQDKSAGTKAPNPTKAIPDSKGAPSQTSASKAAPNQPAQSKSAPATRDKDQGRPPSPSEGSPKTEQAKISRIPLPAQTAPASQTSRTGGSKGTRNAAGSSSSSNTHSARRDSHTDHPVATPHQEERGSGGNGNGSQSNGEGNHHEGSEGMHEWLPPSGQLASKTLKKRVEAEPQPGKSGRLGHESLAISSKRFAIQSAFQSSMLRIFSMFFKHSKVQEHDRAKKVRDSERRRHAANEALEEKAIKHSQESQKLALKTKSEQAIRNSTASKATSDKLAQQGNPVEPRTGAPDQNGPAVMHDSSKPMQNAEPSLTSRRLAMALAA